MYDILARPSGGAILFLNVDVIFPLFEPVIRVLSFQTGTSTFSVTGELETCV